MKCRDHEKSSLAAETLDYNRTSSPMCESKGDDIQSLSRWETFI